MFSSITHSTWFLIVLGIYLAATVLYCLRSIFSKKILSAIALRVTVIGLLIQLVVLILHLIGQGAPYLKSSFETYQVISASMVLIFVVLCFFYRFYATGIVVLPLALIFNILSLKTYVAYQLPGHFLDNPWASVHLVFVFIAISVFLISFVVGLLYLIQENRIKNKKSGGVFDRFPSLEVLDHIHYRSLYIGFIFFTVGIITGGGWSKSITGFYVTNNLKQILSVSLWIFFGLFLFLRVSKGWIGRRGILLSCIGFAAVIFLFSWVQKM